MNRQPRTLPFHNVVTEKGFREALLRFRDADLLSVDIETAGPVKDAALNPYLPGSRVVSISVTNEDEETWVIPLSHPDCGFGYNWRGRLESIALSLLGGNLIAHNAPFEVKHIHRHTDIDLSPSIYWDTQTVAHLLDENQSKRLKNLASHLMGGDWGIDVTDTEGTPWLELATYNADDTIGTLRLYYEQAAMLARSEPLSMLHSEVVRPAQGVLTRASRRGLPLDRGRALAALLRAQRAAEGASIDLGMSAERYGLDPEEFPTVSWEPTSKYFRAFTEKACAAGDLYIQEVTDSGNPSWRKGVLNRLANEGYSMASTILEYRHASKQAQFLEAWVEAAEHDGTVHGDYNIARARTGRLTSSDPNLQQIARDLKYVWGGVEGWHFCEADWSQIEMRVAAEYIHRDVLPDNPMMQAFRNGDDLHVLAACMATAKHPDDITKDDRQKGKAINFGFIFGMGWQKFITYAEETYGVTFTPAEAKRIRADYFVLWEGLGEWHRHQESIVQRQGYVTNLFGRMRRLPAALSSDDYERSEAFRQAINSPVQGTASDLMLLALSRIDALDDTKVVGTVHDSALLLVRTAHDMERAVDLMLLGSEYFAVPLEVEASLGTHWTETTHTIIRSA